MSHLGSGDPSKGEKSQSYVSNQTSRGYLSNNIERFSATHHDGNIGDGVRAKVVEDVKHRHDHEQYRAASAGSRHPEFQSREPMNPSAAVSHSAAVASAAGVYPRVAIVSQHGRATGPQSHFEAYGLPPHISQNQPAASTSHHHSAPVHSLAYRHLLPPHTVLPGQYSNSSAPHVGADVNAMWQQKFNANPWILAQYEEMRLERERAERESRDHERIERHKEERAEKERREWQEQERLDREERERVQREAVRQHFEESLRFVAQKKGMGWNPVAGGKNVGKGRESSPAINLQQSQTIRSAESDRLREQEKERSQITDNHVRQEHERWLAIVQQQRNEQTNVSHHQNFSSAEPRSVRNTSKQEASQMPGHGSSTKSSLNPSPISSSASQMKNETNFSLYGYQPFQHTYITPAQLKAREETKVPSNIQSVRVPSSGQLKANLQMKGEKESLSDRPLTPGSNHTGTLVSQSSSKHQLKGMLPGQERGGIMYQPLVGSGGAFKPYEYTSNSSSPAPPAHQNTTPAVGRIGAPQYQQLQDQPQNLVKSDGKGAQEKINISHKYDSRDNKPAACTASCTLPVSFSSSYVHSKNTSPATNATYSYSLIQQGLVPNPMYIAATHAGSSANASTPPVSFVHSQATSKPPLHSGSPPISQQYTRVSPSSGITSGSPVCRPNSVPYALPPGRGRSYSPVGASSSLSVNAGSSKLHISQDTHLSNRLHVNVQGSGHRSLSPAHLYGPQPNSGGPGSPHQSSPRLTAVSSHHSVHLPGTNTMSSSPFHSNSQPENQDTLGMHSGVPLVKRKLMNDVVSRKRPKSIDDGLLPPQLQPQVQTSESDSGETQTVTPPHLVSNAPILSEHHQSSDSFPAKSNPSSPVITTNLVYKPEPVSTPPSMPDLLGMPLSSNLETNSDFEHSSYISLGKYKMPSKIMTGSPAEESLESSSNSNMLNAPDRTFALSANSLDSSEERLTTSPNVANIPSTNSSSSNHTKLKKAWLQRHSENEDKKNPNENSSDLLISDLPSKTNSDNLETDFDCSKPELFIAIENSVGEKVTEETKIKTCDENSMDESEDAISKSDRIEGESSSSDSDKELGTKSGKKSKINRKHSSDSSAAAGSNKRSKSGNNEGYADDQVSPKKEKDGKKKNSAQERDGSISSKKRGRKTKVKTLPLDESSKKKTLSKSMTAVKPPEKPSVAHLKKTGEPFLQDGPCCEVAPRLPKCRECRMTPHQRSKKMPNIFCRFYAYRKLRYGKNGTILSAGFSEPSDAAEEDLKLWLPPVDSPPVDIEIETSKFLLTHIGDQFCDLVEMEREAQKLHMSNDGTVTWKRVVQGVREMCDVCETTLFNIHWVCHKCGFVVCIDCYKSRKTGVAKDESSSKDRDDFQWLLCTNRQPHEQEKLMMTQIIAGTALWDVGKSLHEIRRKWNIPTYCNCAINDFDQDSRNSSNGICKLMSAVTKCFSSDKESSREANGSSDSPRLTRRSGKSSVNGMVKQEDGLGGYSSESGGSPLSWLADVALNSSTKMSDDQRERDEDRSEDQGSNADASVDSDDDKSENFSTLRELLIRPTGKMGGKSSGSSSSSQKTLTSTLDEVISCVVEQKVRKSDKKCKEKQLLYFTRRYQMSRSGRELPPIRTCILSESSLLYPEIPHIWLGSGKILLLKDPYHSGNMQMFQEQWKRGQPVVVADVGKKLNQLLWSPESFLKEFGDVKVDFLNCLCGTLLQGQPMKKFWEGFDNVNKRMKDEDGESLVLKLIDWPSSSEEFTDLLSSRYDDLMKVLPLSQYTHREGVFNMASRLPECFVQPDLGPRMYNAYGISSSLGKGSTNLHLDVSDAINILAYVAVPRETKEDIASEILNILEESGCDSSMRKRAKGSKVGAIWHVYNARDADKIRDFLNKVSEEQGVKLNPHHDPIHNQEWYLDEKLRNRLYKEYSVEAYTIAQCSGDAIFIPAGSPHQVLNLQSCVKVSEDFVSPESIGHSFFLTQEIRNLSDNPGNHEDKLQVKNIIYHAVKDALALLQSHEPEDSKT